MDNGKEKSKNSKPNTALYLSKYFMAALNMNQTYLSAVEARGVSNCPPKAFIKIISNRYKILTQNIINMQELYKKIVMNRGLKNTYKNQ
jgi:CRISPR/Cas system CMR-associated protein Cmr5 small subunit